MILVTVNLEKQFRLGLDVPNPMGLISILRDQIVTSFVPNIPDLYPVGRFGLPTLSRQIEELMLCVRQKINLLFSSHLWNQIFDFPGT